MRWSHLDTSAAESEPELPLALPEAVLRTFDTPGFAGMTFHEIHAKSIINKAGGMFGHTLNPYRGCSHACTYCLAGDTPILLADGRTKPLSDLRVGDKIYGTEQTGSTRRYVRTEVLAHWSTVKPAYRLTLADGTTLVASGDHRFLTERGWKHVAAAPHGHGKRPYLTDKNRLRGTGRFAEPPADTVDYRRGYLCGLIRNDALSDLEALDRSRDYLSGFGLEAISSLVAWPGVAPTDDWCKGFLAATFDASGGYLRGVLRILSIDKEILTAVEGALDQLGFPFLTEHRGFASVRLLGGLRGHLRFFHTVAPAITSKWTLAGTAIKSDANLAVVSVEDLGLELPLFDLTTGTGDFVANGVVSHNCFARNTHTYLDLDAGLDFDRQVIVKVNAPELLRRELAAPRWRGAAIAMGTNVDCYQRAEGKYGLMRGILTALTDFANPFSILTKGTLILRDLDLLKRAAQVTKVGLAMSIGFVDESLWRSVESGTPSPQRRLDAVRALTDAGFDVSVLMAPILPGLTDQVEHLDRTVAQIAAAGAVSVTPLPLHLRPGAREWYMSWLAREHPRLVQIYLQMYGTGAYLPQAYQRELSARVRSAARRHGIGPASPGRAATAAAPPRDVQLTLL